MTHVCVDGFSAKKMTVLLLRVPSSLLKFVDIDEKFEIENKATVTLAKELGLVA